MMIFKPGQKLPVASHDGRGFSVPAGEAVAQTRNGRQVLSLPAGVEAVAAVPRRGRHPRRRRREPQAADHPRERSPGDDKRPRRDPQKYKDGGLSDARVYEEREGLTWRL